MISRQTLVQLSVFTLFVGLTLACGERNTREPITGSRSGTNTESPLDLGQKASNTENAGQCLSISRLFDQLESQKNQYELRLYTKDIRLMKNENTWPNQPVENAKAHAALLSRDSLQLIEGMETTPLKTALSKLVFEGQEFRQNKCENVVLGSGDTQYTYQVGAINDQLTKNELLLVATDAERPIQAIRFQYLSSNEILIETYGQVENVKACKDEVSGIVRYSYILTWAPRLENLAISGNMSNSLYDYAKPRLQQGLRQEIENRKKGGQRSSRLQMGEVKISSTSYRNLKEVVIPENGLNLQCEE